MKRIDRAAMKRAIEQLRRKGGEDARQIEQKLRDEPWEDVARFAAYSCQCDALNPEPWQPVPANDYVVTDRDDEGPVMGRKAAAELLRRLLAAGLSRYEPDPINALERAEATASLEEEGARCAETQRAWSATH
jgi:hypothetical protein